MPTLSSRQFLVILLLIGAVTAAGAFVLRPAEMIDFAVYLRAALNVRVGAPLYTPVPGALTYQYLPVLAVALVPLTYLSASAAAALWCGLIFAALAGAVLIAIRLIDRPQRFQLPILLAVAVFMPFAIEETRLGQLNAVMMAACLVGVLALRRDQPIESAAALAVAILIKPHALILLPWLLIVHRRSALWTSLFVATPVALVTMTCRGISMIDWLQRLRTDVPEGPAWAPNVSIAFWAARYAGGVRAGVPLAIGAIALLLIAGAVSWRRRVEGSRADASDAVMLLAMIPLINPSGWPVQVLLAMPAAALIASCWASLAPWARMLAAASAMTVGVGGAAVLFADSNTAAPFLTLALLAITALWLSLRHARRV